MRGKQHAALGVLVGTACGIMAFQTPAEQAAFAAACSVGSLFSDIDLPTSAAGRVLKPVSVLLNRLFGHRGFIHSFLCAFLLGAGLYLALMEFLPSFAAPVADGFFAGFLIHLLQDSCTPNGIRWLWPLKHSFHVPFIWCRRESMAKYWILTFLFFAILTAGCFLYTHSI